MKNNPATDHNGFSRSLPRPLILGPFQVLGSNRALTDHSDKSLGRIVGDGFLPTLIAAIAIASAVILTLD